MSVKGRTLHEDNIPSSTDEVVDVDDLEWSKTVQPRDENPEPELINSIDEVGFQKPLIVHRSSSSNTKYSIADGWQRYKAAKSLGYTELPVSVFSVEGAFKQTQHASIVKEFSSYEWVRYHGKYYDSLRKREGCDHQKARQRTKEFSMKGDSTVHKYLTIWKLPEKVHTLMREPEKRSLEGFDGWEKQSIIELDRLSINVAKHIARSYSNGNIDKSEAWEFAKHGTGKKEKVVKNSIEQYVSSEKVFSIKNLIEDKSENLTSPNDLTVNVGHIGFNDKHERKRFEDAKAKLHSTTKDLFKDALEYYLDAQEDAGNL